MDKKKTKAAKPSIKKLLKEPDILAGILITLCASFMLCIYAPYELYITNQQDFWFSAGLLFRPTATLFLLASFAGIAAFFIACLISKKLYYTLLAGALAATIATYIQGTFLVGGLPPMDGTAYDWSQPSPERIKTIVVWVIAIAAVVFICLKFRAKTLKLVTKFVSIALIFMLSTSLVSIFATTFDRDYQGQDKMLLTNKNIQNMSCDTNMVILILDAVDNGTFREAIDSNPEFQNTFDDFTYYNNLLGGYVFTRESLPFIFSGDWYENDEKFSVYQNRAFEEAPLFNALEEKGYTTGFYSTINSCRSMDGNFDNFVEGTSHFTDQIMAMKVAFRMAGIRYAPWDLKSFMFELVSSLDAAHGSNLDYDMYNYRNFSFYQNILQDEPFNTVDGKQCRIIHIEGAHAPYVYDKSMNITGNATYFSSVEACLTICNTYLNALKENDLYDNTAIVIMSDHGYSSATGEMHNLGRTNPILLVKGIDEQHEMILSEAPIAHEDIASSLPGLLDGKAGNDLFEYKEGDRRERRTMIYDFTAEDHMKEYITTGHAGDFSALKPTGEEFILEN